MIQRGTDSAKPDFFIAGAPKCGTSSLYHWLRARRDVFLPHDRPRYWQTKEPNVFCPDIVTDAYRLSEAEYVALFERAPAGAKCGEASPFYLYSDLARATIAERYPKAKVIISVRPPVDFMVSFWRDCLRFGHDHETDFTRAITEPRDPRSIPAGCWYPTLLNYRQRARFSIYLEKYLQTFPSDRLLFLSLREISEDAPGTMRKVLAFIGADPDPPETAMKPKNVNPGVRRTVALERKLEALGTRVPLAAPAWRGGKRMLAALLPDVAETIPRSLLETLEQEFQEESIAIERLTGVSL